MHHWLNNNGRFTAAMRRQFLCKRGKNRAARARSAKSHWPSRTRFRSPRQRSIYVVPCLVNVGLSLWEGMADRRISHGNTKLTCHSRASPRLEQGPYRRSEATSQAKARLGKLPGYDVAAAVIRDCAEIEPAPTNYLEIGEVSLPKLIGRIHLVEGVHPKQKDEIRLFLRNQTARCLTSLNVC